MASECDVAVDEVSMLIGVGMGRREVGQHQIVIGASCTMNVC
jgi:hypothetical protein